MQGKFDSYNGITSKASMLITVPVALAFFFPETSIATVWLPGGKACLLKNLVVFHRWAVEVNETHIHSVQIHLCLSHHGALCHNPLDPCTVEGKLSPCTCLVGV